MVGYSIDDDVTVCMHTGYKDIDVHNVSDVGCDNDGQDVYLVRDDLDVS